MRPGELPGLRRQTVANRKIPGVRDAIAGGFDFFNRTYRGWDVPHKFSHEYAEMEAACLETASLFWASKEMSELAIAATPSLPGFDLTPDVIPCTAGLIWFDSALVTRTGAHHYCAASWHPIATENGDGIVANFYVTAEKVHIVNPGTPDSMGPLFNEFDQIALFGPLEFKDDESRRTSPFGALVSAWLLMGQAGIAESTSREFKLSKGERREGRHDAATVRIVDVARHMKAPTGEHDHADVKYRNRWVVSGHWRNQWYPKTKTHKPKWITPYVKGPEGAPLLTQKETVHAWR